MQLTKHYMPFPVALDHCVKANLRVKTLIRKCVLLAVSFLMQSKLVLIVRFFFQGLVLKQQQKEKPFVLFTILPVRQDIACGQNVRAKVRICLIFLLEWSNGECHAMQALCFLSRKCPSYITCDQALVAYFERTPDRRL